MTSFKGFLYSSGPESPPRMTEKQKAAVVAAVEAALARAWGRRPEAEFRGMLELTQRVVKDAIAGYPADRSCWTCDYLLMAPGPHCRRYHQDVPPEYVEVGCERHQEHGAPF